MYNSGVGTLLVTLFRREYFFFLACYIARSGRWGRTWCCARETETDLNRRINTPVGSLAALVFYIVVARTLLQPSLDVSLFLLYICVVGHLVDLPPVKRRVKYLS